MNGYISLNGTEIILIICFGLIFLLFSYGLPVVIYWLGAKKIQQKQETSGTIVITAFTFQIIGTFLAFTLFFILDLFGKTALFTGGSFSQFVAMFYSVDWSNIRVDRIAMNFSNINKATQIVPTLLILKMLWIALNIAFLIIPLYFIFKIGTQIVLKYKSEMNNSNAYYEIATDFFGTIFFVFLIFAIHTQIPNIFLGYFQKHNQATISQKVGSGETRDYTYQGIVGHYIKTAYEKARGNI